MKKWFLINLPLFIHLLANWHPLQAQVVINEVVSSNSRTVRDEDGDTPDWIELYNPGNEPINLNGWTLTDDSLEVDKWRFPAVTVAGKGFLLVFASDKDRAALNAPLHTSFRLGAGRDPVFLYNPSGQLSNAFPGRCIPSDVSLGRVPDGNTALFHLSVPTPGAQNDAGSRFTIQEGKDTVLFSHTGGFYASGFTLTLAVGSPGTRLHYTTDGTVPDETSPEYKGPFFVASQQAQKNNYADIPTSPLWTPPNENVTKATVIRAVAYINGCPASPVITHSYFVDLQVKSRYRFPVLSMNVDEGDFFGKKRGIYVVGESPDGFPNYNRSGGSWEREVHLEYFAPDGKLQHQQIVGARVHGRGSRANPQKSLRLYADTEYGKESIDFPFFNQLPIRSFQRLILRSPDADFSQTLFKDELIHTILRPTGLELQASQPVVAFLNGEYWGIHHLRERQDRFYLSNHFGIHPDSVDILGSDLGNEEIIEGDSRHYRQLLQYIRENDVQVPSHYNYVRTQMDVENFIEYQIAELYFANFDWPHNNNRFWRPRQAGGKWRWFFFDCDACMTKHSYPELTRYLGEEEFNTPDRFLLRNLLRNDQFRNQFVNRFFYRLNTTFEPGLVIGTIEQFRNQYAPMVAEHIARWNTPASYTHWLEALEEMKGFAMQRPAEMIRQLTQLFPQPFQLYPNPATDQVFVRGNPDGDIPIQVTFLTPTGQPVKSFALNKQPEGMNISALPAGLYLVRIEYGRILFTQKIVVTH